MSDDNYTNILLEDMNSKFDAIMEAVSPVADIQNKQSATQNYLEEMKSDIKVIKAAVTDLSSQVNNHETRITHLETA